MARSSFAVIYTHQLPRAVVAAISVARLRNHERQQYTNLHNLPHSKLTVKEKQRHYDIKNKTKLSGIKTITIRGFTTTGKPAEQNRFTISFLWNRVLVTLHFTSYVVNSFIHCRISHINAANTTSFREGWVVLGTLSLSSGEAEHGAKSEFPSTSSTGSPNGSP